RWITRKKGAVQFLGNKIAWRQQDAPEWSWTGSAIKLHFISMLPNYPGRRRIAADDNFHN
ncbi:MAG: hypothetical protein KDG89_17620, partial [Geminicoccaceae bacterium]|nr:hypothetical protein [Geminicoccaceae bacterium]